MFVTCSVKGSLSDDLEKTQLFFSARVWDFALLLLVTSLGNAEIFCWPYHQPDTCQIGFRQYWTFLNWQTWQLITWAKTVWLQPGDFLGILSSCLLLESTIRIVHQNWMSINDKYLILQIYARYLRNNRSILLKINKRKNRNNQTPDRLDNKIKPPPAIPLCVWQLILFPPKQWLPLARYL